jgi:protein gp37
MSTTSLVSDSSTDWETTTVNKQDGQHRIEWTDYTWNPITGCLHGCEWKMPDGRNAVCYAKTLAETSDNLKAIYNQGFAHHYFYPQRLKEPLSTKIPSKIFCDSMGDIAGGWVPMENIISVCDAMKNANWHTFQSLTKAPHRVHLVPWPKNVWVGVSSPPDVYMGKEISDKSKTQYLENTFNHLIGREGMGNKVWMSLEPVSWDIEIDLEKAGLFDILDWVVIGAASRGKQVAQPKPEWVKKLVARCDLHDIPIFYKGNLRSNKAVQDDWREQFPATIPVVEEDPQNILF